MFSMPGVSFIFFINSLASSSSSLSLIDPSFILVSNFEPTVLIIPINLDGSFNRFENTSPIFEASPKLILRSATVSSAISLAREPNLPFIKSDMLL